MVSRNAIEALSKRAAQLLEQNILTTEEATKHALVLPFIQALGYDIFDPMEVVPEYTADFGLKQGEKVDYAIVREDNDGEPAMLIECKKVSDPLDVSKASQLSRYFSQTPAHIGILTNGVAYKFFSDLDAENVMDATPALPQQNRYPTQMVASNKMLPKIGEAIAWEEASARWQNRNCWRRSETATELHRSVRKA